MKRMLFGCTLILCGSIGTLSTWFIRYIKYRGYSDFGILFTYSVLAVPFVLSLIFLLSGLCLCICELVRDYKQK